MYPTSEIWVRIPAQPQVGKAGSSMLLVCSLQYKTLTNCMYWKWPIQCVESGIKTQINTNTLLQHSCHIRLRYIVFLLYKNKYRSGVEEATVVLWVTHSPPNPQDDSSNTSPQPMREFVARWPVPNGQCSDSIWTAYVVQPDHFPLATEAPQHLAWLEVGWVTVWVLRQVRADTQWLGWSLKWRSRGNITF